MKTVGEILEEAYDLQELSLSGMGWKVAHKIAPRTAGRAIRRRIVQANAEIGARRGYWDTLRRQDRSLKTKSTKELLRSDPTVRKYRSKRDELMRILGATGKKKKK